MGRGNVIAETDCGLGTSAGHPKIARDKVAVGAKVAVAEQTLVKESGKP